MKHARCVLRSVSFSALTVATLLSLGCTSLMAQDNSEPMPKGEPKAYEDWSAQEVIQRAVVTSSILPDGRVVLILRNGKVLDASELPELPLPSAIEGGTNTNVNTIAVFAVQGSPVEIRGNFGFGPVCYVYDNLTGGYLGSCPKEQYR